MGFLSQVARTAGRTYDYATPGSGTSGLTQFGRGLQGAEDYSNANRDPNQPAYNPNASITPLGGGNVLGASDTSGAYDADGSGGGSDKALTLAELAAQEGQLRDFLASSGGQLDQGVSSINDDAARLRAKNAQDRGRSDQDFAIRTEDTQRAKDDKFDSIDTNARVQANSLRNIVGRASGSGSSAYKLAVPGAITRDASLDRQGVQEDFGANFRDLTLAKKRVGEDFDESDQDVNRQVNDKTRALREGILTAQNDASGSLADIARRRAAVQGGNVAAAGAGFDADVSNRRQAINSLFNTYKTPLQARAVDTTAPSLRDYVTDGTAVAAPAAEGVPAGTSPYSSFLKKRDEEFAY